MTFIDVYVECFMIYFTVFLLVFRDLAFFTVNHSPHVLSINIFITGTLMIIIITIMFMSLSIIIYFTSSLILPFK